MPEQQVPDDRAVSQRDMLQAAKWWSSVGVAVFPVNYMMLTNKMAWVCSCGNSDCTGKNQAKHPMMVRNGLKDATTDPVQITDWWTRHPAANIGLRTGITFDVLDVDGPDGEESYEALVTYLGGEPERMAMVTTGRTDGGRHIYIPAIGAKNATGGKNDQPVGLDVRGEGGYVIAPPSAHMSGAEYSFIERWGTLTGSISWGDTQAGMKAVGAAQRRATAALTKPNKNSAVNVVTPTIDPFVSMDTGASTPEALAWLAKRCDELRATPEGAREVTMSQYAIADAARMIQSGELDRGVAEAAIRAAAKDSGLDAANIAKVPRGIDHILDKGITKELQPSLYNRPGAAAVTAYPADTPDDDLFDGPGRPFSRDVPTFPTWTLGAAQGWIESIAEQLQCPVDIPAMLYLSTLSVAVRGRACVKINPTWYEPLNTYIAVVANPGEAKSPALGMVSASLHQLEKEMIEEARPRVNEARDRRDIQQDRVTKAKSNAAKEAGDERYGLEDVAHAEREKLDALPEVYLPRLLVGDVTPEALVRVMAEQGGVMASLSAEGGLFDTLAGRYSKGVANLDAVLQAHDGKEPILVDRRGAEPLRVERPCLTLGLAVQPTVLTTIGANEAAMGRGLLARFLYTVPPSRVGTRDMDFDRVTDANRAIHASSSNYVTELLSRPIGTIGTMSLSTPNSRVVVVVTDTAARTRVISWRSDLERRRHPDTGDLASLGGWVSKLDAQVWRLIGLLALAHHAEAEYHGDMVPMVPIDQSSNSVVPPAPTQRAPRRGTVVPRGQSRDTTPTVPATLVAPPEIVDAALAIADYLIVHAQAAYELMAHREPVNLGRQLFAWAVSNAEATGSLTFTIREAGRGLHGRAVFENNDDIHIAAHELVERGWVVPIASGTKSVVYRLNPHALSN